MTGLKVKDVTGCVLQYLPDRREFLWTGAGYGFQKTESDILISGMKRITTMAGPKNDITALPLHDAVLVARRHAMAVKQVLEEAAVQVAGVRLPEKIEEWRLWEGGVHDHQPPIAGRDVADTLSTT